MIRPVTLADAAQIARIYNHYVCQTTVTFEETEVSAEEIGARIQAVHAQQLPWLVAEVDGQLAGYAYAAPWRTRSAYRYSVESSVYVDASRLGSGLGRALYGELLPLLRAGGIHVVIGGITLPNVRSVALHERMGFHQVAHFQEVGWKFGQWLDVGYWQLELTPPA